MNGTIGTTNMEAYEDMIRHTASKDAPWYVIPADNDGFC
jgi:polyphosphate kinase 2 (PPK2 family)